MTLVLGSSSRTKQGWIEDDLPELLKGGGKGLAEFLFSSDLKYDAERQISMSQSRKVSFLMNRFVIYPRKI